jgi:Na+/H+ antiporter NhaD/arsenite permease-like protein
MSSRYLKLLFLFLCLLMVAAPFAAFPAEGATEKPAAVTTIPGGAEQESHRGAPRQDPQEELGRMLSFYSVIPFIVILLAIALIPLIHGHWWESNLNKGVVAIFCSLPILAYLFWIGPLGQEVLADIMRDYYAFIMLLVALFTISGGIYLEGNLKATPLVNTIFIAIGSVLASFIGTTGAAMLLIRPLLNTNRERKHKAHIFIFFTFLVCNIGGSLLPVGDPPLFLGYLFGVPFFWTLRLWPIWLTEVALILAIFYFWDTWAYSKETKADLKHDERAQKGIKIHGIFNIVLIWGVLLAVVVLRKYEIDGRHIDLAWMQQPAMILLALISFVVDHNKKEKANRHGHTHFKAPRELNAFNFNAIIEVAVLFVGIFITMTPAICLLKAFGAQTGVHYAWEFFWMSGGLSSFLDNAPTYATYFALGQGVTKGLLASGAQLSLVETTTGPIAEHILIAISVGSVFMGANSYIGNAPNFMVKTICEEAKVKMPSFFGYMAYSCGILVPSFLLIMYIYLL